MSISRRKAPTSSTAITKSSEELEMERIKELRQELARKRKIAEDSLRAATTATGYVPIRSGHPLTKPDEFHFATDTRVKTHKMETRGDVDVQDFAAGLRKTTTSVNKVRSLSVLISTFWPGQNDQHFADDNFKYILIKISVFQYRFHL